MSTDDGCSSVVPVKHGECFEVAACAFDPGNPWACVLSLTVVLIGDSHSSLASHKDGMTSSTVGSDVQYRSAEPAVDGVILWTRSSMLH